MTPKPISNSLSIPSDEKCPVQIEPGTDLNNLNEPTATGFGPEVFESLPEILRELCNSLTDVNEREVFLVGALGLLSGVFPNVIGNYDGTKVETNLYFYILAPFGSGKGTLKFGFDLIEPIHSFRKEMYEQEIIPYRSALKDFKDGVLEIEPERPGRKLLVLPANNTKSGIIQMLDSNNGRGIIFETEGETLAQALKMEQGNFVDILLRAFQHEPITMCRRTNDEYREIINPKLSIVMSSTMDQYRKLIPDVENGLFSRILHYWLTPNPGFRDVFNPEITGFPEIVRVAGRHVLNIYQELIGRQDNPLLFSLTAGQKQKFLEYFQSLKSEIREHVSSDLDGSVNRMGLCSYRLAMLLTALRKLPDGKHHSNLNCEDIDFQNALNMIGVFKQHTLRTFYKLPSPKVPPEVAEKEKKLLEKAEKIAMAKLLFKQGNSYAKIAGIMLGDRNKKSLVYYWINH